MASIICFLRINSGSGIPINGDNGIIGVFDSNTTQSKKLISEAKELGNWRLITVNKKTKVNSIIVMANGLVYGTNYKPETVFKKMKEEYEFWHSPSIQNS